MAGNRRGTHPNSIANLRPGVGGGRPKGSENSVSSKVRALLRKRIEGDPLLSKIAGGLRLKGKDLNGADVMAAALYRLACKGNPTAVREVLERTEGKVPLGIEHSGPGGRPLRVSVEAVRGILGIGEDRLSAALAGRDDVDDDGLLGGG